jgi:hypothetical protein
MNLQPSKTDVPPHEAYIPGHFAALDESNVAIAVAATEKIKKTPVKRQKEGLLCKGQRIRIYPTQEQEIPT